MGYRLIAEPPRRCVAADYPANSYAAGGSSWLRSAEPDCGAREKARVAEAQRLIDRGDILLRDAVPLQAGEALPPLRSALEIDPEMRGRLGCWRSLKRRARTMAEAQMPARRCGLRRGLREPRCSAIGTSRMRASR